MGQLFNKEAAFEDALIAALQRKGWGERPVLLYPTEEELIQNWKDILFQNNNTIDCLNGHPLTDGEMQQILTQITDQRTPFNLNKFVNGKTITITRDNQADEAHYGGTVTMRIYDRQEIAGGHSVYQIARQPKFKARQELFAERRGDVMLLINGMPLIHIELKRSGVPVMTACNQIETYSKEGIFSGLFSLIQVFVAMTPEETKYFANPGPDGKFNPTFYFHWEDFNNELINDWQEIAETLLSIPMAHQLIGFYTVPDADDGVLKIMRSYQYIAANKICDRVNRRNWKVKDQLGGYVWHTTGSGKTLTSFKSAQLIALSSPEYKVVFLVDRIELGTQSFEKYKKFSETKDSVQDTKNTNALIAKLKSNTPQDQLIVTSIQKMSNISEESMADRMAELEKIREHKLVIIIDEAHRSVFGEMYPVIRKTFPMALIFGFTGTPIKEENQRNMNTTVSLFGSELHHYTMSDGIRDGNVKGFDPVQVATFRDRDLRRAVALEKAHVQTEAEVFGDEQKERVYYHYMNDVKMIGEENPDGTVVKGIEDLIPSNQYDSDKHRRAVVEDIIENFPRLSRGGKFHAIFATSNIPEAIAYYRLFKELAPGMKVSSLFDPTIDFSGSGAYDKEAALIEIIKGYNELYDKHYKRETFPSMKEDLSKRLAHNEPYQNIASQPDLQLDLLIVVDQMLTGFDSKWVNTLYLDKELKQEGLIQAFSRTNRPFGDDKPFGIIRYYRKVHTMERNIAEAVRMYAGDRPYEVFVDKLPHNLRKLNEIFTEIKELFESAGIENMSALPPLDAEKARFAKLFKSFNDHLQAAKLQGFIWENPTKLDDGSDFNMVVTKEDFDVMIARYKELYEGNGGGTGTPIAPYDIDIHITEVETGRIDYNYMNSRFDKYLKDLNEGNIDPERLQKTLDELHKSYAQLSQEEQYFADLFLHDVQSGDAKLNVCKTFHDYIVDYMNQAQLGKINKLVTYLGLDGELLTEMANSHLNEANLDDFGRYTRLVHSVNKVLARAFFEQREGQRLTPPKVNMKTDILLRRFIIKGEFE